MFVSRVPGGIRIIALPFAAVVGTIGYFVEQGMSKPKEIPYLNTSIQEQREQRLLQEERRAEAIVVDKQHMVPKTLRLNTERSSLE
uniref:Small integral membrane protein 12 n=1 Tax=Steinernema glaseri TaxID=37863 RepID=A0A1I8ABR9_9BILA